MCLFLLIVPKNSGFQRGKLTVPEGDSSLGEIVGGEFQRDFISGEHPDAITAEPAGQVGQHDAVVFELYAEQTARKLFQHGSSYFDAVFFTHTPQNSNAGQRVGGRPAQIISWL